MFYSYGNYMMMMGDTIRSSRATYNAKFDEKYAYTY